MAKSDRYSADTKPEVIPASNLVDLRDQSYAKCF